MNTWTELGFVLVTLRFPLVCPGLRWFNLVTEHIQKLTAAAPVCKGSFLLWWRNGLLALLSTYYSETGAGEHGSTHDRSGTACVFFHPVVLIIHLVLNSIGTRPLVASRPRCGAHLRLCMHLPACMEVKAEHGPYSFDW